MKDWKAAVRYWEKNGFSTPKTAQPDRPVKQRVLTDYEIAHGSYDGVTGFTPDTHLCRNPECQPCAEKRAKGLTR